MNDYEELRNVVKLKDYNADFEIINSRIDMIMTNEDREDRIKALICMLEKKLDGRVEGWLLPICYALVIGGISLGSRDINLIFYFGIIFILAALVLIFLYSIIFRKKNQTDIFILHALRFKLEDIYLHKKVAKSVKNKKIKCKEYIIRVSKK